MAPFTRRPIFPYFSRFPAPSIPGLVALFFFISVFLIPFFALAGLSTAAERSPSASGPSRSAPISPAQSTPSIPGGWQRIEPYTDTFSIALPPGWAFVPLQGIDSQVGEFTGDGIRLFFDYGAYSNPLAEPGEPGYAVSFERIDCKQAKIVEAVDAPARTTGVYFGEIDRQRIDEFVWVTKLQVNGTDLEPEERALVLQILRTIRFEQRCLSTGLGDWEIFDAPLARSREGWEQPYLLGVDMLNDHEALAVGAMFSPDDPDFVGCSALRFDGQDWRPMGCEANFPLTALDVVSSDVGWAGGFVELLSLDGEAWRKPQPPPGPFGFIRDLRMSGPDRGRAVGDGFDLVYEDGGWSRGASDMDGQALVLAGPDDGWALGEEALYRLTEGRWSEPIDGGSIRLGGQGIALGGETVWIGGQNPDSGLGEIIGYDPDRGPFEAVEFAKTSQVHDLAVFASGGQGIAVGGNDEDGPAMIFERRGGLWTPYALPFDGEIFDLELRGEYTGWAVGYREDEELGGSIGVMLRFVGRGAQLETPTPTGSASPTPPPISTTPPGPEPGSPTPELTATGTPTPAGGEGTPQPPPGGTLFLPVVAKNAAVASSANQRLVVALRQEPDSLFLYSASFSPPQAQDLWAALYEPPFDTLGYAPRPALVEALPRIGESAWMHPVVVEPGERYVDAWSGEVLEAEERIEHLWQLEARWTIAEGMHWEDGFPVTAADSVWSRSLACEPDIPTDKHLCERSAEYRAEGARSLVWKGLPGYRPSGFEAFVAPPLPRHQRGTEGRRMDEMSAEEILGDAVFSHRPLANGPFRIVEWRAGEVIRMERNPWYRLGGREGTGTGLEVLIFRLGLPQGTWLDELRGGTLDLIPPGALGAAQVDALRAGEAEGLLQPHVYAGRVWEHLSLNVDPLPSEEGEQAPLTACRDLRHALSMAIDRPTLADIQTAGASPLMQGILPPGHWAAPERGEALPAQLRFDPAGAEARLEAMGFTDEDGDGLREASRDIECPVTRHDRDDVLHVVPFGTPLRLRYFTVAGNPARAETASLVRSNLEAVGVAVDLELAPPPELFEDGPDGPVFGRRAFHLAQFAWAATDEPDLGWLYACDQIPSEDNAWSGQNASGWCEPDFDQLAHEAFWAPERSLAAEAARDAQDLWIHALPVIPLYLRPQVAAARAGLVGPSPDASVASLLWNIEAWRWDSDEN